jgi:hypothetical protein
VAGRLELDERRLQTRSPIDARGEDHRGAFVEDDIELQSQIADDLENGRLIRLPGGQIEWPTESGAILRFSMNRGEALARAVRRLDRRSAVSVFGDNPIEDRKLWERLLQMWQFTLPGNQDQPPAAFLEFLHCLDRWSSISPS